MKEYLPEIDDLIAKVLTDEASGAEQAEFKAWLDESPDNRQYFDDLKKVWDNSADALNALDVDTDKAWVNVQKRIHSQNNALKIKWLSTSNILKLAAALALIFTAYVVFTKNEKIEQRVYVAENTVKQDTLNDGSIITLNKKAQLTTVFSKTERRVKLEGKAYFAVAPNKEKPFVIEAKALEVKVVGTEFTVDDQSLPNNVIVIVEEGIVEVKGKNNEIKTLKKGEKVVYDLLMNAFTMVGKNEDKNAMAFKTQTLEFDGTPLKDVVKKLNEFYGDSVEIASPAIENCPISFSRIIDLEKKSLDEVLEGLYDAIVKEKKNGKIYLTGNGCE
jgi:transmembrane sensor